jgi:hypothetical protein
VKGSTWIPVFDVDTSSDLNGLSKKAFSFAMGMLNEIPLCPLNFAHVLFLQTFFELCLHFFII